MAQNANASLRSPTTATTVVEVNATDLEALLSTVDTYRARIAFLETSLAASAEAVDLNASREAEIRVCI